ncbi:HWE histidine kinase domain-containing protein [Rhizobium sp. S152]|uniref:sensor histidine kinase n=1 Tax=Rhizobium sp. S152 TaxID=3055038 RepID=UPI0025AA04A5|nr:PAS domain-containing sensor histidine kinase [Rhizobium sp. S152]MDM9626002.1 HWE histidine kinase domain-containing protein [Rhizobium sp. S152]
MIGKGSLVDRTEPLLGLPFAAEGKAVLMERALASAGISVVFQDPDLSIVYAENLPPHFEGIAVPGGSDAELFGEAHGANLEALKARVLETGAPASTEVDIAIEGEMRTYELKIQRVGVEHVTGVLSIITEVTEVRHREKVLKSLLRELSHRSKNLLAIIQGIATQTARNTLSLDGFLVKFRGRLQSLSNSQDLVTDSSWRGAFLFELAQKQFAPYWPEMAGAVPIFGTNIHLTPNAAVHLGLALHELIVNSASHGTIAHGTPSIALDCQEAALSGRRAIQISWIEILNDKSEVHEFSDNSFGKTVLERVVPSSVNGKAELNLLPGRIEYRLTIPDAEFEILKRAPQMVATR